VKNVTAILKKLKAAKILLKLKKCYFYKKEVIFLGYVIIIIKLTINLKKIKAILE
jgi:hypothetical protein